MPFYSRRIKNKNKALSLVSFSSKFYSKFKTTRIKHGAYSVFWKVYRFSIFSWIRVRIAWYALASHIVNSDLLRLGYSIDGSLCVVVCVKEEIGGERWVHVACLRCYLCWNFARQKWWNQKNVVFLCFCLHTNYGALISFKIMIIANQVAS